MQRIKIKISSLVDGVPWLFVGEGELSTRGNKTVLHATEETPQKVIHQIEFSQSSICITRLAESRTRLEFYEDKKGKVSLSTPFGDMEGKTITKSYTIRETTSGVHIALRYHTDFESASQLEKKVQISYSLI